MTEGSISTSQSGIYKFFCVMWDEYSSFSVTIANTETVDDLKYKIKEKKKPELDHIAADKLMLYQVDILDDDDADTEENVKKILSEPLPKVLKANKKLSQLYAATPPEDNIHILVKVPSSGSKRKAPATSSSDSEVLSDHKKRKVQHKPRLSDPADGLYSRSSTVETLYKKLTEHKFIFVRGTPASGKSSLAMLLRKYITKNHPEKETCFVPCYRNEPDQKRSMDYLKWLEKNGWNFPSNGVLILDEAQLSYWDDSFWLTFIKAINASTPYMVILFASYGSAGRHLLHNTTPLEVEEAQLVGLSRGPTGDLVGLLLTREEMQGVVEKSFPDHHFDDSLLDYVYSLTSGHVGACYDSLRVVSKDQSYRANNRRYTYDDFVLNLDMSIFLDQLSSQGIFSRGLPMRDDLEDPKKSFVTSLRDVLDAPSCFVLLEKEEDQRNSKHPLRLCLERGWLFSEPAGPTKVKYLFASQLHELYTGWLLLKREDLIKDPDLQTFVIKVIGRFSPQNLQIREDLSTKPQSIPEAQFQQEFYRACCDYTGGCVTTFPECGTPKGRIDFFIRSKKWGVELLRDGARLNQHNSRFTTGEYGTWFLEGSMSDYIMIDFRLGMPDKARPDIKRLIFVVSRDNWKTLEIYDHELEEIKGLNLLYHNP